MNRGINKIPGNTTEEKRQSSRSLIKKCTRMYKLSAATDGHVHKSTVLNKAAVLCRNKFFSRKTCY